MQISDLKRSITQMSDEELYAFIKDTRKRRRVEDKVKKKKAITKAKSKRKTHTKKVKVNTNNLSVNQLIKSMTSEQIAEFIKSLEE